MKVDVILQIESEYFDAVFAKVLGCRGAETTGGSGDDGFLIVLSVFIPEGWGCCAFAGDRGMLHPELTASATAVESAEIAAADAERDGFDDFVSANRTCEIGMSRATGCRVE